MRRNNLNFGVCGKSTTPRGVGRLKKKKKEKKTKEKRISK